MVTVVLFFLLSTFILIVEDHFFIRFSSGTHKVHFLGMLPFIFLLIFTRNNPDYAVYESVFNNGGGPFSEAKGFVFFSNIVKEMGFNSYEAFLLIIGFILVLLVCSWNRNLENVHYAIFFYSLFVMYYDVIQIRNCIATFFVLSILIILLNMKIDIVKVLLIILFSIIAISFHPVAVLQLVLLAFVIICPPQKQYTINLKTIILVVGGTISVFAAGRQILSVLGSKIPFFWKISLYLTSSLDYKSCAIWLFSSVTMVSIIYKYGVKEILSNRNCETKLSDDTKDLMYKVSILFRLALFSVVLSPLTLIMDEIVRIYRFLFFVIFILYAVIRHKINRGNKEIIFLTICAVNIAFMLMWCIRGTNFDMFW